MGTIEKQTALELVRPKLPSVRDRVLRALMASRKGLTSKGLSTYLNVKFNTVVGRLDELQDEGKVYGAVREGQTYYRFMESPELQRKLALMRSEEKFIRDIKKLRKRYSDIISKETFDRIIEEAETGFLNRKSI